MNNLQRNLAEICCRYGVTSLYVFGSRASEARELLSHEREAFEATPSDLEIAVMPDAGIDFGARAKVRLSTEIEDLLQVPRVDPVVLSEASAFLAADAVRGELLYCDDPDRQAHEELYILRRAGDLAHFEEERLAGILSGGAENVTPSSVRARLVLEKSAWIRNALGAIRTLPIQSIEEFESDWRNPSAAESYLRRGLEALFDLGRHILAKGFGRRVVQYKEIPAALSEYGVIDAAAAVLMTDLVGYRNRLVHFYDEVSHKELYDICTRQLGDVDRVLDAILTWLRQNPEKLDTEI